MTKSDHDRAKALLKKEKEDWNSRSQWAFGIKRQWQCPNCGGMMRKPNAHLDQSRTPPSIRCPKKALNTPSMPSDITKVCQDE